MSLPRLLLHASLCALLGTSALHAQPAPDARIRAVMDRPEFAHASWGMEFYDLDARKAIVSSLVVDPGTNSRSPFRLAMTFLASRS